MKKLLLFFISLLAGTALFVWVAQRVGWKEIQDTLAVFTCLKGLAILGLTALIAVIGTWKWKEILRGEGVKTSFKDLFGLYLAVFSIRYLAPVIIIGAEILQGYALKEKNQVPWSKGMASVIIDRILEWTTNLAVIFLGTLFFLLSIGLPPTKLLIIFGSVFFAALFGLGFFYFKTFKKESMAKALGRIFNQQLDSQPLEVEEEIFSFFKLKNPFLWKALGISLLRALAMYARAWILITFLGETIGGSAVLSVLGSSYLATMMPIPTALGFHELIQTFVFGSLGLSLASATAFTMIIRGAELLISFVGIIILFKLGVILLTNNLLKKAEHLLKVFKVSKKK